MPGFTDSPILRTVSNINTLTDMYLFARYEHFRSDYVDPGLFNIIDIDSAPPSYMSNTDEHRLVEHQEKTFRCLPETDSIEIKADEPVKEVALTVVDCRDISSFEIRLSDESGDQTETVQKISFSDGPHGGWTTVPITIDGPGTREVGIELDIEDDSASVLPRFASWLGSSILPVKPRGSPWLTAPSIRPPASSENAPPVVLVSIDSLRYDYLDEMTALLDALDGDAVIPEEPRVQGHFTRPSHGSMLTGLYPGVHKYFSYESRLARDNRTLAELLTDNQYRCSGCVSMESLGPQYGMTSGFDRFIKRQISWRNRINDTADLVATVNRWIDRDVKRDIDDRLFYFLHLTDVHYPYFGYDGLDGEDLDLRTVDKYGDLALETGDYLAVQRGECVMPQAETIERIRNYYQDAVDFVARQLRRLVETLRQNGIYRDALIIVTGDHGEEFFERGFGMHHTLYDANIRPGFIVKPPADAGFDVPDDPDIIDIMPTIAEMVGESSAEEFDGTPWQTGNRPRYRIAERIDNDSYSVSVERDGWKGIFTYEVDDYGRPKRNKIDDGPVMTEFYELEAVRRGDFENRRTDVPDQLRREFEREHVSFLSEASVAAGESTEGDVPSVVNDRLEQLGYK